MRSTITISERMSRAWDWLWAYKTDGNDWRDEPWITATELERRFRADCAEELLKRPYGSEGNDTYGRVRISTGSRYDLLSECRDWLILQVHNGKLEGHNFGTRTISGMRFRPKGYRKTDAELKRLAIPEKERQRLRAIVHYEAPADPSKPLPLGGYRKRLCDHNRVVHPFSHRKWVHTTAEADRVTCKRCLSILAKSTSTK